MKKLILLFATFATVSVSAIAQDLSDPRYATYGETLEERKANALLVNYFGDAYKTKAFDEALVMLNQIIERCPKASLNTYIRGMEMYRTKLNRAQSKAEKLLYLDSMMYMFDKRMEFFPTHKDYGIQKDISRKALTYYEYNKENYEKAFDYFRNAINTNKDLIDPEMCIVFFNALTEEFKMGTVGPEEYIVDYELIMDMLGNVSVTEEDKEAMVVIENLFASSGAASCEVIETIFKPKYEANPDDADLVKKILAMYSRSKCSSDFQLSLTEKFYNIEPTPELAAMLGAIYEEKQEFDKALSYFNTAIAGETDIAKKTNLLIRSASATINANKFREAADYARQIIAIDPDNGYGYLFLAGAYAGGIRGCSDFNQKAAYWLIVDTYVQARNRLSGDDAQVSNINSMISSYSAQFPKVEDTFMRGLSPGDRYTVSCGWVSGATTVRER